MKLLYVIPVLALLLFNSCKEPGEVQIENKVTGAVLKNVEWGDLPVTWQLYPGEVSPTVKVYHSSYYDIDLPESHQVKFYMQVDGDAIYLVTNEYFSLDYDEKILVSITDSTKVYNPQVSGAKNDVVTLKNLVAEK